MLPEAVLEQAKEELLDWQGSGMSVMEMSHRSKEYISIAEQAEADLRELLTIPDNYKVLFLQGGASTQFAMVPLNLLRGSNQADYFNTGLWSEKAVAEAKKYCQVNLAVDAKVNKYTTVPPRKEWKCNSQAAYLHYTPNETINGLEFHTIPEVEVPIVADMSSTLLSRPLEVSKFALIYAGAQKNIGPAGLTIVIIRDDLIDIVMGGAPTMLSYKTHIENSSMYNTPPTYAWYIAGLVFKWLKNLGGLEEMGKRNQRKAEMLYAAIDGSEGFYKNPVDPTYHSWMNVPFALADDHLNDPFLKAAKQAGLVTLAGHRSVGGMRASIYNAMPEEGVKALLDFMNDFATRKG
jgi:phosphoserine aminotransferase